MGFRDFWNQNVSGGMSGPSQAGVGDQLQNFLRLLAAGGNPTNQSADAYQRPAISNFDPTNFPGVPGGTEAVNAMGLSTGLSQDQINEGGIPLSNLTAAAPTMDPQMQNLLYQMLIQQFRGMNR